MIGRIEKMLKNGKTRHFIAGKTGMTVAALAKFMKENNLKTPNCEEAKKLKNRRVEYAIELKEQGKTRSEISEAMGVKPSTVSTYIRIAGDAKRRGSKEANVARALELYGKGRTASEIADRMRMAESTITNYLREAGRTVKSICPECKRLERLEAPFRGRRLCAACLLDYQNPADKVSIEEAYEWQSISNSGANACI